MRSRRDLRRLRVVLTFSSEAVRPLSNSSVLLGISDSKLDSVVFGGIGETKIASSIVIVRLFVTNAFETSALGVAMTPASEAVETLRETPKSVAVAVAARLVCSAPFPAPEF